MRIVPCMRARIASPGATPGVERLFPLGAGGELPEGAGRGSLRSHDALVAQLGDLSGVVTQLGEDIVGVVT